MNTPEAGFGRFLALTHDVVYRENFLLADYTSTFVLNLSTGSKRRTPSLLGICLK